MTAPFGVLLILVGLMTAGLGSLAGFAFLAVGVTVYLGALWFGWR